MTAAPYYRDEQVTLYHGDALDLLPQLGDATAAAVVTDPPYVLTSASSHNARVGGWPDLMNNAVWFTAWYREIRRIMRDDASFWTFCNWRTVPTVTRAATAAGLHLSGMVVWDKQVIGTGGPRGLRSTYELIALMPAPGFTIRDRGLSDVWRHRVNFRKEHGHPAEKPLGIVAQVFDACQLDDGALVVDPFAGSGTTLAAAKTAGLHAIGVEADERWCEVAARRLAAVPLLPASPTSVGHTPAGGHDGA